MRHQLRLVVSIVALAVFAGWCAPIASAMVPLPDPAGSSPVASGSSGAIAVWQVIGIALIAVAIGAVGAVIAQRMHRDQPSAVTVA